jgi:HEAT repeat protein
LHEDEHPKVRRAAAAGLGHFEKDDVAASALIGRILEGDASYFVEAECCWSLGKTRSPQTRATLDKALDRDSFMDVIRQHVFRGLAAARDTSAIDLLLERSQYGYHSYGRREAMMAAAELGRRASDAERIRVREALEGYLKDADFRVQGRAIEALAKLADPAAGGALQKVVDANRDGRLVRRSREVIRDLGEGRSNSEQLSELRDKSQKLEKELYELRGKLELMEAKKEKAAQSRQRLRRTGGKKTVPSRRS